MTTAFRMTFLGVGSGLTPELGNTNVLVESPEASDSLLLDCGFTAPQTLLSLDRLREVRHIVVSHVHADHAGGVEAVAHLSRYVYQQRPRLYIPAPMWDELWCGALRGGLERTQTPDGKPALATLDDYFEVQVLEETSPCVTIPHLPTVTLRPTLHVSGKPAYGVFLGDRVYYSADTQQLPPRLGPTGEPLEAIFQDCQLVRGPSNVHTTLDQLTEEMPDEQKRITHLMHYGRGYEALDAKVRGFAGFVHAMQVFDFVG